MKRDKLFNISENGWPQQFLWCEMANVTHSINKWNWPERDSNQKYTKFEASVAIKLDQTNYKELHNLLDASEEAGVRQKGKQTFLEHAKHSSFGQQQQQKS